MRHPTKEELERLIDLLDPLQSLNMQHCFPPDFDQLKHFFLIKAQNFKERMKKVGDEYAYHWLINQESEEHRARDGKKLGYINATTIAFGTPNPERWGEDWAISMSQWVLINALGSVKKYEHLEDPSKCRDDIFHELTLRIAIQPLDCWLNFFLEEVLRYLYPHESIKASKGKTKEEIKEFDATIKLIKELRMRINNDTHLPHLFACTGLYDFGNIDLSLSQLEGALSFTNSLIEIDASQYGKADETAHERHLIRSVWHWLIQAGLGSQPSVIMNLLSMPSISPHAPSLRSVESLISKLKTEASLRFIPGITTSIDCEPFGSCLDSEFQLRMLDTSKYRR